MAGKNVNNEQIDAIIRYLSDQMTPEERNHFERTLQRDPFEAEAIEGFSSWPLKTVISDLNGLKITKSNLNWSKIFIRSLVITGSTALVALLIFFSIQVLPGVFSNFNLKTKIESIKKQTPAQPETSAQQVPDPIVADSLTAQDTIGISSADSINFPPGSPKDFGVRVLADTKVTEPQTTAKSKKITPKTNPVRRIEPLQPIDTKTAVARESSSDQIVSTPQSTAEIQSIQPPAKEQNPSPVLARTNNEEVASSEAVTSGLDVVPQPLGGEKLFRSYLESNCHYPTASGSNNKETVRIKFKVSANGNPFGISVTKSPGPAFSSEAIRLIIEGPRWSPAVKDGKPVVGEVTLKINFKP